MLAVLKALMTRNAVLSLSGRSHIAGADRIWCVRSKRFRGFDRRVRSVDADPRSLEDMSANIGFSLGRENYLDAS